MFKRAYIMQAALLLALTGCAASRPADMQADASRTIAPAGRTTAISAGIIPETGRTSVHQAPKSSTGDIGSPKTVPAVKTPASQPVPPSNKPELLSPEMAHFAEATAAQRQIPLAHVQSLLQEASYNPRVAQLMAPPKTRIRKSWSTYRKRFVDPVRISTGLQFWQDHRQQLDTVANQYGVPASIIVAIIGVETIYGRYMGDFRVLDALATLAFHYPDKARTDRIQLFRDQLADLLVLDYRQLLDARTASGSYAGAMGLPQFMPGSLLRYAVDGDNDGLINLTSSPQDAIASVANFLRKHGWQPGLPVFAPVNLSAQAAPLVDGGLTPALSWPVLQAHGATEAASTRPTDWKHTPLGVIDLVDESQGRAEYRAGTANFFAITQYNRSYFYATAVTELARTLASRMNAL